MAPHPIRNAPVPRAVGDHLLDLLPIGAPEPRLADGKDRGGPECGKGWEDSFMDCGASQLFNTNDML